MNVVWAALVLLLTPTGDIKIVYDPRSYDTQKECEARIDKIKPSSIVVYKDCLMIFPGQDV